MDIAYQVLGDGLPDLLVLPGPFVPIDSIEVEVEAVIDPRALTAGFESTPVYPQNISYVVKIESSAPEARIEQLRVAVERACPILNLLKNPQTIAGRVALARPIAIAAE